ncbi:MULTISPECIES: hypothetical protein [Micromonospora]|uniref:Uncharacterized protein n=1 Tax=Micromonospora solifontis TaxID=2487138 RepID=A0ABX9WL02_9ACTN|nr:MULTISPECIES: hypothetical protein [Micromonospora]NES14933.1 hypothetical protein [Micromonospora sp. PPF5-17B]NES35144.1 hypothetical protein [Micromonospora solifontis]NES55139.1 hypothetical protein [Micromonospora sp. PPF5-6]RNM01129.1 hypothetical protein EFE23_03020 [Micromonospora solifontis]
MSTQAASTRPMNRPAPDVQNRAAMQEAPTRPMAAYDGHRERAMGAPGTETKQSFATTEFWVYVASVAAVLIASYLVGKNSVGVDIFRAPQAWFFITLLTIGYLGSRGLAKAGSNFRSGEERRARH